MLRALAFLACLTACGPSASTPADASSPAPSDAGTSASDAGSADAAVDAGLDAGALQYDAGPTVVVPARWPSTGMAVTHDVDRDLNAVLETANLANACTQLKAGATDTTTRLRCGKWMFFYETFGTVGVPSTLLDFLQKHYADTYYGLGFSRLGMVADPASTTGRPLGLAPTTGKIGTVETRAFTCAACHFGQLPDGRYAVGYGNQALDYGRFIASLGAPLSLTFNASDPKVHPQLRMELAQPVAQAKLKSGYTTEAITLGLGLLGAGTTGTASLDDQGRFLGLQKGTMDFLTAPLVDDGVWTVSRILSLWNLPDADQRRVAGMPHEALSWNGGIVSLELFAEGFVVIGHGTSGWSRVQLAPLIEYIRTLRTPALETPPIQADVTAGAGLFATRNCVGCHAGPSGEGARVYTFAELGTDSAYGNLYNPAVDGTPCCGLGDASNVTRGVKAPRLAGALWNTRLLHNGALGSLEELFCVVPRPMVMLPAQTATGHTMTCDGLTAEEKRVLISYLRSL